MDPPSHVSNKVSQVQTKALRDLPTPIPAMVTTCLNLELVPAGRVCAMCPWSTPMVSRGLIWSLVVLSSRPAPSQQVSEGRWPSAALCFSTRRDGFETCPHRVHVAFVPLFRPWTRAPTCGQAEVSTYPLACCWRSTEGSSVTDAVGNALTCPRAPACVPRQIVCTAGMPTLRPPKWPSGLFSHAHPPSVPPAASLGNLCPGSHSAPGRLPTSRGLTVPAGIPEGLLLPVTWVLGPPLPPSNTSEAGGLIPSCRRLDSVPPEDSRSPRTSESDLTWKPVSYRCGWLRTSSEVLPQEEF